MSTLVRASCSFMAMMLNVLNMLNMLKVLKINKRKLRAPYWEGQS